MRNSRAGIGSTGRIPGPTSALQFRIPHSAFRIGLVDWFNAVDATYRADLRELNELNFARFDAKLEQRLAQVKSDLVKWMFVFWAPTALGVVSLLLLRR